MEIAIILFLIVFGVVMLILELFFIPGITFAAITGFAAFVGAVWYAFSFIGIGAGYYTLAAILVLSALATWGFLRAKTLDKMTLDTQINSSVDDSERKVNIGEQGVTITRLAPIGNVRIGDEIFEAKAVGGIIEQNTPIIIKALTKPFTVEVLK